MPEQIEHRPPVETDSMPAPATDIDKYTLRPPSPNRFRLVPLSEIELGNQPEWLVDGLLPSSGLAFVYGPSGSYKSTITLDVAMAVASGQDWCGRTVLAGAVVYVAAEGGQGMRKRLQGLSEFKGNADAPLFLCPAAPNLGTGSADRDDLIAAIEENQADIAPLRLIVIDTLSRSLGGADENGSGMQAVINNAKELAERFGCLVLIVHHTGHDRRAHMRGHSSAHGDADAIWKVSRNPKMDLEAGIVVEKLKDGEDGHRLAMRLLPFCLRNSDSTILVAANAIEGRVPDSTEPTFSGRQGKAYRVFRDCTANLEAGSSIELAALNKEFNANSSQSIASNRDAMKNMLNKLEDVGFINRAPDGRTTTITILRRLE
jgi:hypothetical protein